MASDSVAKITSTHTGIIFILFFFECQLIRLFPILKQKSTWRRGIPTGGTGTAPVDCGGDPGPAKCNWQSIEPKWPGDEPPDEPDQPGPGRHSSGCGGVYDVELIELIQLRAIARFAPGKTIEDGK